LLREACRLAIEHGRFRMLVRLGAAWNREYPSRGNGRADSADLAEAVRCNHGRTADSDYSDSCGDAFAATHRLQRMEAESPKVPFAQENARTRLPSVVALPLVVESKSAGCLVSPLMCVRSWTKRKCRLLTELARRHLVCTRSHCQVGAVETTSLLRLAHGACEIATFFHERLSQYVSAATRENVRSLS